MNGPMRNSDERAATTDGKRSSLLAGLAVLVGACLWSLAACDRTSGRGEPEGASSRPPVQSPDARPPSAGDLFPLRVEPGKRFLVDAQGKPFFVSGDTAWSLIVQLTAEQVEDYLEDRRRRGFNAVLVNLIEHEFAANAPRNAYGDEPFERPGDFARPNERYFAHADDVLRRAADKGILVLLAPAYAGYGGGSQGWYREMRANGAVKLRAYGRYLGNRYRHAANIVWVQGGDFNVPDKHLVRAIAEGIREADSKPHTYHGSRGTAALEYWGTDETWLNVNNIYTDSASVAPAALEAYARSSLPFFLIEAEYEGDKTDGYGARVQAYQAVLSGAAGHVYGNNPIWHFGSTRWPTRSPISWREALGSTGARSMTHLANLLTSRPWWTLQPDSKAKLLVDHTGEGASRPVAAVAGDGAFALAYLPRSQSITLNLQALAGPRVAARWMDPASGAYSDVSGSSFEAAGPRTFRPSRLNSSGEEDWVLLLESVPRPEPRQRTESPRSGGDNPRAPIDAAVRLTRTTWQRIKVARRRSARGARHRG